MPSLILRLPLVSKVAGRVPGWVGRFLLPEIERVVEKAVNSLRSEMNAKFEAVNARLDSIGKRFDLVQDVAVLKAEVKEIRDKLANR
jgi:cell shape-determining protein MreC